MARAAIAGRYPPVTFLEELMPLPAVLARAGLPAARQAARAILAAGGRLLGSGAVVSGVAAGGAGVLASRAFGGGRAEAPIQIRMPRSRVGGMFYGRRRRGRGITAAELRGARKVANLVKMYGLRPKVGRIHGRKRH